MAKVFIPFNLRKYADGASEADVPGSTLGKLIDNLEERYPGIKDHLVEDGRLKPGLAAVVGHAATRQGLLQKLEDDTEVHFVPAISGG
ncbi:MAG: MoaD/ThiS family protein [Dehalococcoidia bacterium]